MKAKILALLRESEDYISGQELCGHFGVSRTAVWKVMNQLKEDGYEVEAVPNKGYRLLSSPDILNESEVKSRLQTAWLAHTMHFLSEVDSTNLEAKRLTNAPWENGTLVLADRQTAGRGRRGRGWESPSGVNIFYTLLLKPPVIPDKASMLTLVMALSVAKGIEETTKAPCAIKWPNDIVVNGKKICGILTEMDAEPGYIHHVVLGVGINVNMRDIPEELREHATSLAEECGHQISRSTLLAAILAHFEKDYADFLQTEDLSVLLPAYHERLINRNRTVRVLDPQGEFEGTAEGITPAGELLVRKADDTLETVYAGEVSVRGLYGYV